MKDISSHLRSIIATTTSKTIQMQIEMCDLVLSGFDFFLLCSAILILLFLLGSMMAGTATYNEAIHV